MKPQMAIFAVPVKKPCIPSSSLDGSREFTEPRHNAGRSIAEFRLIFPDQPRRLRMAALAAGAQAPEFSLASHLDKPYALSSFKGKRTVVSFLPFAFTGG